MLGWDLFCFTWLRGNFKRGMSCHRTTILSLRARYRRTQKLEGEKCWNIYLVYFGLWLQSQLQLYYGVLFLLTACKCVSIGTSIYYRFIWLVLSFSCLFVCRVLSLFDFQPDRKNQTRKAWWKTGIRVIIMVCHAVQRRHGNRLSILRCGWTDQPLRN